MRNYLLLAVVLFCFSCKGKRTVPIDNYYFAEAQPVNDSELSEFPNRYIGKYRSEDSTFLSIQKKLILSESYTTFRISKSTLDTLKQEYDFTGNKLTGKVNKEIYDVIAKGDSLELSSKDIDTVFIFSENAKAKKINGNLVLSRKDSGYWKVEWLRLKKDVLVSNWIFSAEDLTRVDSLVKTKTTKLEASQYLIKPTRREFGKIMGLKKFGNQYTYEKIKD